MVAVELIDHLEGEEQASALLLAAESLMHLNDHGQSAGLLKRCKSVVQACLRLREDSDYDLLSGVVETSDNLVSSQGLARIQSKLAQCLMSGGDFAGAKSIIIEIPVNMRNVECWYDLGVCHENLGEMRDAAWAMAAVLRLEPYAYEALEKIIALGFRESVDYAEDLADTKDLKLLFESDLMLRKFHYNEAISILVALQTRHPTNSDIQLRLAVALFKNGRNQDACNVFRDLYAQHPFLMKGKDVYAGILISFSKVVELTQLVSTIIGTTSKNHSPEAWTVLARYCESINQIERGLIYTDKALSIDQHHIEALMVRGFLLNKLNKFVDALNSFKRAHKLYPDAHTYDSLVNICINLQKTREALAITKEMSHYLGGYEKTPICVGNVLQMAGQHVKAASAFQTALNRNPDSVEAIFGLTGVLCSQGQHDAAIRILEKCQTRYRTDWMHVRLGEIYSSKNDLQSALYHFITALSINPECEKAKKAANQIESDLRGDGTVDDDNSAMTHEEPAEFEDDDSIL